MVHEPRIMEAVELHVNATYYVQYYALKSVDEKSQSLMGGKFFFFYRTLFELAQGLRNSKISVMNCLYERDTCPERSIGHMS